MQCPKCKGTQINFTATTYTKTKSRSFLWNLFMIIITGGIWLIWMLVRKKKEVVITEKIAICQTCGYNWKY